MIRPGELLFYIWILSISFNRFSLVGTLSLDNILGPLLIVIWPMVRPESDPLYARAQSKNIFIAGLIILAYFIVHAITLISTQVAFWNAIYTTITDLSYFTVPLLYIRNDRVRSRAEDCVIAVALVGAFSAFLSAIGVLHLEVARFSDSRIAIEGVDLTRSVGVITAYGDMALLSAFSVMVAMSVKRQKLLFLKRSRLVFLFIVAILLLGLLGSQSRNMVLTIGTSVILFLLIKRWSGRNASWIPKFYALLAVGAVSLLIFVVFLWQPIVDFLAGWGGKQASATAHERLAQYQFALELLRGNLFTGADAEIQERMQLTIGGIHNMWLKELVQGGLAAVLTLIGFIVLGMKNATKCLANNASDEAARMSLVLMVALMLSSQFNVGGTPVFWMLLGFGVAKICTGAETKQSPALEQSKVAEPVSDKLLKSKRSSLISRRGG